VGYTSRCRHHNNTGLSVTAFEVDSLMARDERQQVNGREPDAAQ